MFAAFCRSQNGVAYQPCNRSTGAITELDTLDKAKKAAAELVADPNYKSYFLAGYDLIVIDLDKGTVASRAKVEPPSLNWKDAS